MSENNLQAPPAVLTAQITVVRAGTGKVEHYTLTGTPVQDEQPQQKQKQKEQ